jgi:hypothetical protein
MPTIPFPEYAPDLSDIETAYSALVQGCIPRKDGYGPFPTLQAFSQSLPSACRGMFVARRTDGTVAIFGATSTDLYLLDNTSFTWSNVSKGGTSYSALLSGQNWRIVQFADTVVAVQRGTVPQKFVLASSAAFEDLGGSPPACSHIAVIGGFLVLSGIVSLPQRVQWSDLYGIETWTAGVGFSDFQDLADGGTVHTVAGCDLFGVLFQDDRIRRLVYVPGSAAVFEMVVVSTAESIIGEYSPITLGNKIMYLSSQGFRAIGGDGEPTYIGKERVDRTVLADLDTTNLQLLQGSTDPSGTRAMWAYKSNNGHADLFDKIVCFDFALNKWTVLSQSGEYLTSFQKPGVTLEGLDALAPGQITISGAADNGSGAIRLTVSALTNGAFTLGAVGAQAQNFIEVQDVGGTTEANGSWAYTIIDATHIDLVGSTFTNAYTSGGAIGGALDSLSAPFDTYSSAALAQLGAAGADHKLGFFTGPSMEAIIETGEMDGDGMMSFVTGVTPITDAAEAMVSIGYRKRPQDAVTYSTETAIDDNTGQAPQLVESRYLKARLRIPAGSDWTYARGVKPEVQIAGEV